MQLCKKFTTGRIVSGLFFVTTGVYLAMGFHFIPSVLEDAPGMRLFDMCPGGYNRADAMNLIEAIGPRGREAYLYRQLPLDFVYPGLSAVTYPLMLVWLFKKS